MKFTKKSLNAILVSAALLTAGIAPTQAVADNMTVKAVKQINPTAVELRLDNSQRMTIDFYGENIFRLFQDNNGGILRDPFATPEAKILVNNPRKEVASIDIKESDKAYTIKTSQIEIAVCKKSGLIKVTDLTTGKVVIEETAPVLFKNAKTTITLKGNEGEFFYGGGVQNGRFSHAGKVIDIENQNSWTDGGVASPAPFFWSTNGYGFMWHTFRKGEYEEWSW